MLDRKNDTHLPVLHLDLFVATPQRYANIASSRLLDLEPQASTAGYRFFRQAHLVPWNREKHLECRSIGIVVFPLFLPGLGPGPGPGLF